MDQPHESHRAELRGSHGWLSVLSGLVGALIFYTHAKFIGGAAEDHIAWQIGYGFVVGWLVVVMADAVAFEYRKFKGEGEGSRTFWRFARTWTGLAFFVVELLLLGFAIWVISDPNSFADFSHFNS